MRRPRKLANANYCMRIPHPPRGCQEENKKSAREGLTGVSIVGTVVIAGGPLCPPAPSPLQHLRLAQGPQGQDGAAKDIALVNRP